MSAAGPNLAVFDIDGTLTQTNAVDDECFLAAVAEVLEIDVALLDWSGAPHVTDTGLLEWFAERHHGRTVRDGESGAVLDRFMTLLGDQLASAPARFCPVAGAPLVVDALRAAGWEVALATGGWQSSAQMKLRAIGLDPVDLVMASSSDAATRVEILELAHSRALTRGARFRRIVSIGDGVWDVRAAAEIGWPFVGVAEGDRARKLREAGATTIVPDLANVVVLLDALDSAVVPRPTSRC